MVLLQFRAGLRLYSLTEFEEAKKAAEEFGKKVVLAIGDDEVQPATLVFMGMTRDKEDAISLLQYSGREGCLSAILSALRYTPYPAIAQALNGTLGEVLMNVVYGFQCEQFDGSGEQVLDRMLRRVGALQASFSQDDVSCAQAGRLESVRAMMYAESRSELFTQLQEVYSANGTLKYLSTVPSEMLSEVYFMAAPEDFEPKESDEILEELTQLSGCESDLDYGDFHVPDPDFSDVLSSLRKIFNKTMDEAAACTGMSAEDYQEIEHGAVEPSVEKQESMLRDIVMSSTQ